MRRNQRKQTKTNKQKPKQTKAKRPCRETEPKLSPKEANEKSSCLQPKEAALQQASEKRLDRSLKPTIRLNNFSLVHRFSHLHLGPFLHILFYSGSKAHVCFTLPSLKDIQQQLLSLRTFHHWAQEGVQLLQALRSDRRGRPVSLRPCSGYASAKEFTRLSRIMKLQF